MFGPLTKHEWQGVDHHSSKSIGNVEDGIFAKQVSNDSETFSISVNKTDTYITYAICFNNS